MTLSVLFIRQCELRISEVNLRQLAEIFLWEFLCESTYLYSEEQIRSFFMNKYVEFKPKFRCSKRVISAASLTICLISLGWAVPHSVNAADNAMHSVEETPLHRIYHVKFIDQHHHVIYEGEAPGIPGKGILLSKEARYQLRGYTCSSKKQDEIIALKAPQDTKTVVSYVFPRVTCDHTMKTANYILNCHFDDQPTLRRNIYVDYTADIVKNYLANTERATNVRIYSTKEINGDQLILPIFKGYQLSPKSIQSVKVTGVMTTADDFQGMGQYRDVGPFDLYFIKKNNTAGSGSVITPDQPGDSAGSDQTISDKKDSSTDTPSHQDDSGQTNKGQTSKNTGSQTEQSSSTDDHKIKGHDDSTQTDKKTTEEGSQTDHPGSIDDQTQTDKPEIHDDGTQTKDPATNDSQTQTDSPSYNDSSTQTDSSRDQGTQTDQDGVKDETSQTGHGGVKDDDIQTDKNESNEQGGQTDSSKKSDGITQTDDHPTKDSATQTDHDWTQDDTTQTDEHSARDDIAQADKADKKKGQEAGSHTANPTVTDEVSQTDDTATKVDGPMTNDQNADADTVKQKDTNAEQKKEAQKGTDAPSQTPDENTNDQGSQVDDDLVNDSTKIDEIEDAKTTQTNTMTPNKNIQADTTLSDPVDVNDKNNSYVHRQDHFSSAGTDHVNREDKAEPSNSPVMEPSSVAPLNDLQLPSTGSSDSAKENKENSAASDLEKINELNQMPTNPDGAKDAQLPQTGNDHHTLWAAVLGAIMAIGSAWGLTKRRR